MTHTKTAIELVLQMHQQYSDGIHSTGTNIYTLYRLWWPALGTNGGVFYIGGVHLTNQAME
jgi:hypothetical protein